MQTRDFPWYETVDNKEPVLQGDFLLSCPVFIPTTESLFNEGESPAGDIEEYDVIVMSQSCDLVLKKLDLVLVCPIWSLGELERENDYFKKREGKETLRQGNVPGYHLLNVCDIDGFQREYTAVDFRHSYSLPFNLVIDIAQKQDKRLRLLPPYREHLSQAYARFFMRVGLPVDIPKFK